MCGIFFTLSNQINKKSCLGALHKIDHRGPDGFDYLINDNYFIGHTRLSIRDLSDNSKQPKTSLCGKFIISYNGELYNPDFLLNKLKNKIKLKNPNSDTEILVNYISIYGIDAALRDIEGMYSFIVIDKNKNLAYGARDKFGEKPMYIYRKNNDFAVSSDLSSIKKIYQKQSINNESVNMFFSMGYILSPNSIYKDIIKLRPGHIFTFKIKNCGNHDFKIDKYFDLLNSTSNTTTKNDISTTIIHDNLKKSIESQLISDVEVGTFLSGGIDSSLITAIASTFNDNIKSFTIGFYEKEYDESSYAKEIADYLKIKNYSFKVKPNDLLKTIDLISDVYTEPFADSSQIPTIILNKFASNHIKVALTGDGGDEIFAGYNRYIYYLRSKYFLFSNEKFNNFILKPLLTFIYRGNFEKVSKIKNKISKIKDIDSYYRSMIMNDINEEIFIGKNFNFKISDNYRDKFKSDIDYMQYLDIKYYLPDDLLVKIDRSSMFYGLETRAPFLNEKLLNNGFYMNENRKVNFLKGKIPLREILSLYLPKKLFNRKKSGFGVPIAHWFRFDLFDWVYEMINNSNLGHLIDTKYFMKILLIHKEGKLDYSQILWRYCVFHLWYDRHFK